MVAKIPQIGSAELYGYRSPSSTTVAGFEWSRLQQLIQAPEILKKISKEAKGED
jgi:hypothetical protein